MTALSSDAGSYDIGATLHTSQSAPAQTPFSSNTAALDAPGSSVSQVARTHDASQVPLALEFVETPFLSSDTAVLRLDDVVAWTDDAGHSKLRRPPRCRRIPRQLNYVLRQWRARSWRLRRHSCRQIVPRHWDHLVHRCRTCPGRPPASARTLRRPCRRIPPHLTLPVPRYRNTPVGPGALASTRSWKPTVCGLPRSPGPQARHWCQCDRAAPCG
ncbi:hypothetical protein DFH06DRAFT_1172351, partial [Mycena polygramma]